MIAVYAALASAAVSLALGGWLGVRWEEGNQAIALKAANDARKVAEQNAADVALTTTFGFNELQEFKVWAYDLSVEQVLAEGLG